MAANLSSEILPALSLRPLPPGKRAGLRAALQANGLPSSDIDDAGKRFYEAVEGGCVVGFVGAELFAPECLLRSLVVLPAHRGRCRGSAILALVQDTLAAEGVRRFWALTTTASGLLAAQGFARRTRDEAPEALGATGEFSSLCPASAVLMARDLG